MKRLNLWNSLDDSSNEKIKFLARFDGNHELAKWAFIRSVDEEDTKVSPISRKLTASVPEMLPKPARKPLAGDLSFLGGYLFLIIIPNLVLKAQCVTDILIMRYTLCTFCLVFVVFGYWRLR